MATTGKKEYTLQINGIDTAIKDSTSLLEVLRALDSEVEKGASVTSAAAKSSQNRRAALSEEEKAAKKLEETQKKIKAAQEGATDAQVRANQALREATREQTLRVRAEQVSANSIEGMRIELSRLKDELKVMELGTEEFRAMSEEVRALNDRLKEAEQSTGDFRRNVGNYESALDGVKNLGEGIDDVTKAGLGFTQSLMASTQLLGLFGTETEESAEATRNLQKVLALLSLAQQVNSNLLKEGTLFKVKDAAAEKLRAVQTAIATAATKASSAALGLFKKALIATGIGAVVVALGTLAANFDKVKKVVLDLLPGLKDTGAAFDEIRAVLRGVGEAVVNWVLVPFRTAMAVIQKLVKGDFKGAINAGLDEIKRGYNVAANYQKGYEEQSLRNAKRAEVERAKLRTSELDNLIKDNEARYGSDWKYTEEARQAYAELFAAKKLMYEGDAEALRDLQREEWRYHLELEQRQKKSTTSASGSTAEQRATAELKAVREAEDARVKLIEDGTERARRTIELSYLRQIEDLRLRLKTESDLTVATREALNDKIVSLEAQQSADLQKLEEERAERMRALERELEDSRTSLIENSYERRMTEINLQYDRRIESYKKYLDEEEGLTEKQRKRVDELILNAQKARGIALSRLWGEQLEKIAGLQLSAVDDTLKSIEDKIENAVARKKDGSGLIDVKGTRENLAEVDSALDEYILGLNKYLDAAKMAYDAVSSTLQGSELEAEQQTYARTVESVTGRINAAYALQAENAERSKGIQLEALTELLDRMSEYAHAAAQVIASVAETWNMGLQVQLDDLNAQLDALEERYEKAQKQREDAVAHVEEIESRLQAATGGTTEALKAQLQEAMHARADAEREEQRLAKEKEKLEAQAARREKQMRRNELMSQIAQGIANTAEGATTALRWGPILGPILAAMVTALGLAQVGIMTRQLTKLADGGEIVGPSHADGGVPIPGTNYEAEGGEFVVNKRSYRANADLVRFINDTPRAITAADLMGVVPRGDTPVVNVAAGRGGEDRIIEAIEGIDFQPVVAVTDINDVNKEMVTVKDLAGF